jgi:hypothetical protein
LAEVLNPKLLLGLTVMFEQNITVRPIRCDRKTGEKAVYGERQWTPSGMSTTFLLKTFSHVPYVSMGREESDSAT